MAVGGGVGAAGEGAVEEEEGEKAREGGEADGLLVSGAGEGMWESVQESIAWVDLGLSVNGL